MCFCYICDKTIHFKSKSIYMYSKSQKHKEKFSVIVREYEIISPDNNKIDYIINNCARD